MWEILHSYPLDLKKCFLFFCTGSDRCPSGGLGKLSFIVAKHGDDSRLPTASTCNNLFLLPPYKSKDILEKKLTFALNNTTGFGLI
ncbi:HECT-type E3 ubiquitin transferase [Entamoeba marina]